MAEDRYRIELFAETALVDEDAVVDFWVREEALSPEEARVRVAEVMFVALDGRELAAVSSTYLRWDHRLGLTFWHYRTFVGSRHRQSGLAITLGIRAHEYVSGRFVTGEDTRGVGGMLEVESEVLKQATNTAVWGPPDYTFIGENDRGDHVRIHFYPGALTPEAPPPAP